MQVNRIVQILYKHMMIFENAYSIILFINKLKEEIGFVKNRL